LLLKIKNYNKLLKLHYYKLINKMGKIESKAAALELGENGE